MLRLAIPNKGSLSESAVHMLKEAGYKCRPEVNALTTVDRSNGIEFFFIRPKDIAIYVGSGHVDGGITGRDLVADSKSDVAEHLSLGFGRSTFRYAGRVGEGWSVEKLEGARIATSYPNIVRADLSKRGVDAKVIRLDGAVEISIQLGVADCIADVVSTGRTLRAHGLEAFGPIVCDSEGVLIGHKCPDSTAGIKKLSARLRGVVVAQQFIMLDMNCPKTLLEEVERIIPGIDSPTISLMADPNWIAVRSIVPRSIVNQTMDQLHAVGAKAILASDIRASRLWVGAGSEWCSPPIGRLDSASMIEADREGTKVPSINAIIR